MWINLNNDEMLRFEATEETNNKITSISVA